MPRRLYGLLSGRSKRSRSYLHQATGQWPAKEHFPPSSLDVGPTCPHLSSLLMPTFCIPSGWLNLSQTVYSATTRLGMQYNMAPFCPTCPL